MTKLYKDSKSRLTQRAPDGATARDSGRVLQTFVP